MKSGKKLLSFLIFLGVSACSPLSHTPPPSLAGPVATAVLPTSTPMGNFVEVTRVVVTAVSTATPAPCTPLIEGMHLTIRSEDGQTILLEAEGLLPEDKPIVLLKGTGINQTYERDTFPGNPVGPSGRYQDSFYLGDYGIIDWTGQIVHQRGTICFEFTLPLTEPIVLEATDDLKQGDTAPVWVPYHSEVLNISYQLPNSWDVAERDGILYLTSPEQYALGDSPQQLVYFIYASEFKNPDGLPLEEVVASNLSDELRQIFSYTTETIGHYTIHRTTHMPSAEGALTVFFATEGRFVSLALTPYRPENPFEAQEQYVRLFEQILDSVQLLDNE